MNGSGLAANGIREQGPGTRDQGPESRRNGARDPDPWLLLRIFTLVVLVLICGFMMLFISDVLASERRWLNLGLMAAGLVTGLICVFSAPRRSVGQQVSAKWNAILGTLSLLFLITLIILNPLGVPTVGKNADWFAAIGTYLKPIVLAILMFLYLELLWGLVSFEKEAPPRGDRHLRFHHLQRMNVRHYLVYLIILIGLGIGFVLVVAVITVRYVARSPPAFLHSLAASTPYPYFIVGMIGLGVLMLLLGVFYLRYRLAKAGVRPELEME